MSLIDFCSRRGSEGIEVASRTLLLADVLLEGPSYGVATESARTVTTPFAWEMGSAELLH
jgi:hypothetical protein